MSLTQKLALCGGSLLVGAALAAVSPEAYRIRDLTPTACVEKNSRRPADLFYNGGMALIYAGLLGGIYNILTKNDD